MRDIKFRGKRLDNGEWVYGGLIADGKGNYAIAKLVILNNCNTASVHMVDPATVGQYTGLKDKNDKKIWVGDIFKDDRGVVRSVFRVPGGFAFEDNPAAFGYDHRSPLYPYSPLADLQSASWLSQCCEIIGNIHDNPKLLKQ